MPAMTDHGDGQGVAAQARTVAALRQWLSAQPGAGPVALLETHISYVLLAGPVVYKIKKAVDLGFLDFTTLARRRYDCDEELRLNRRLAPALYLGVVPVTGSADAPTLDGPGPAIDWAVKMRAFAQDGLWDRLAAQGALAPAAVDALTETLCAFHRGAEVADAAAGLGRSAQVRAPVRDSLRALRTLCMAADAQAHLAVLERWEAAAFDALREVFDERLRDGWVRECHGDLHLGNVAQWEGQTLPFDCLEFDPALRWIDVMSEVAFMAMDLQAHGLTGLSHRFVNGYVECSGDVAGLRVLRYYMVYRALVRARVTALRQAAPGAVQRYLDVALDGTHAAAPVLLLTHGVSGSGKTLLTQSLLELCGAIRLRADVERKRLFGLPPLARSSAASEPRLYTHDATAATQARLRERAAMAVRSGYSVILDATFLQYEQREAARQLAQALGVRCVILDFRATPDTLRQRVSQRALRGDDASDADLAVLEAQLAQAQPLRPHEQAAVFTVDAEAAFDPAAMAGRWARLLQTLAATDLVAAQPPPL